MGGEVEQYKVDVTTNVDLSITHVPRVRKCEPIDYAVCCRDAQAIDDNDDDDDGNNKVWRRLHSIRRPAAEFRDRATYEGKLKGFGADGAVCDALRSIDAKNEERRAFLIDCVHRGTSTRLVCEGYFTQTTHKEIFCLYSSYFKLFQFTGESLVEILTKNLDFESIVACKYRNSHTGLDEIAVFCKDFFFRFCQFQSLAKKKQEVNFKVKLTTWGEPVPKKIQIVFHKGKKKRFLVSDPFIYGYKDNVVAHVFPDRLLLFKINPENGLVLFKTIETIFKLKINNFKRLDTAKAKIFPLDDACKRFAMLYNFYNTNYIAVLDSLNKTVNLEFIVEIASLSTYSFLFTDGRYLFLNSPDSMIKLDLDHYRSNDPTHSKCGYTVHKHSDCTEPCIIGTSTVFESNGVQMRVFGDVQNKCLLVYSNGAFWRVDNLERYFPKNFDPFGIAHIEDNFFYIYSERSNQYLIELNISQDGKDNNIKVLQTFESFGSIFACQILNNYDSSLKTLITTSGLDKAGALNYINLDIETEVIKSIKLDKVLLMYYIKHDDFEVYIITIATPQLSTQNMVLKFVSENTTPEIKVLDQDIVAVKKVNGKCLIVLKNKIFDLKIADKIELFEVEKFEHCITSAEKVILDRNKEDLLIVTTNSTIKQLCSQETLSIGEQQEIILTTAIENHFIVLSSSEFSVYDVQKNKLISKHPISFNVLPTSMAYNRKLQRILFGFPNGRVSEWSISSEFDQFVEAKSYKISPLPVNVVSNETFTITLIQAPSIIAVYCSQNLLSIQNDGMSSNISFAIDMQSQSAGTSNLNSVISICSTSDSQKVVKINESELTYNIKSIPIGITPRMLTANQENSFIVIVGQKRCYKHLEGKEEEQEPEPGKEEEQEPEPGKEEEQEPEPGKEEEQEPKPKIAKYYTNIDGNGQKLPTENYTAIDESVDVGNLNYPCIGSYVLIYGYFNQRLIEALEIHPEMSVNFAKVLNLSYAPNRSFCSLFLIGCSYNVEYTVPRGKLFAYAFKDKQENLQLIKEIDLSPVFTCLVLKDDTFIVTSHRSLIIYAYDELDELKVLDEYSNAFFFSHEMYKINDNYVAALDCNNHLTLIELDDLKIKRVLFMDQYAEFFTSMCQIEPNNFISAGSNNSIIWTKLQSDQLGYMKMKHKSSFNLSEGINHICHGSLLDMLKSPTSDPKDEKSLKESNLNFITVVTSTGSIYSVSLLNLSDLNMEKEIPKSRLSSMAPNFEYQLFRKIKDSKMELINENYDSCECILADGIFEPLKFDCSTNLLDVVQNQAKLLSIKSNTVSLDERLGVVGVESSNFQDIGPVREEVYDGDSLTDGSHSGSGNSEDTAESIL